MSNNIKKGFPVFGVTLMWFFGMGIFLFTTSPILPATGYIYYHFRIPSIRPDVSIIIEEQEKDYDDEWQCWHATIEGDTPYRWRWWYGMNRNYENITFSWESHSRYHEDDNNDENNAKGTIELHLPDMHYTSKNGNGILTKELLCYWLTGQTKPATPNAEKCIDAVMKFFEDARDGQLPRPRHHGYDLKPPLSGAMQHFDLGLFIPLYTAILWTALWGWWVRSIIKRRRSKKTVEIG